jgi:hypothetical protein
MIPYTILLFLLFYVSRTVHASPGKIYFNYQPITDPTDWLEIITLCFAPLIAHVAGGVPPATLFGRPSQHPSWLARLPHFNPISIVWRYMAIADRRVRAKSWDRSDMAAANAVFWVGREGRWDGSEKMMTRSRKWITMKPELAHTPLWSASTIITLVTTFQGFWATFLIISTLVPGPHHGFSQGLPYIFLPLSCIGVMRVVGSAWMSGEYGYEDPEEKGEGGDVAGVAEGERLVGIQSVRGVGILEKTASDRLLSATSGKGIAFQIF